MHERPDLPSAFTQSGRLAAPRQHVRPFMSPTKSIQIVRGIEYKDGFNHHSRT